MVAAQPSGWRWASARSDDSTGFAAIIVAFVGRLHPVGILFASLLIALLYLGGEAAQLELKLPPAVTGVFQGLLLFFVLGTDVLARYRIVRQRGRKAAAA